MDSRDLTRGERGSSMVIVLLVLIPILAFGVAGLSTARFGRGETRRERAIV